MNRISNKKKNNNKSSQHITSLCATFSFLAVAFSALCSFALNPTATIQERLQDLPIAFAYVFILYAIGAVFFAFGYLLIRLNSDWVQQSLDNLATKSNGKLLMKNSAYIHQDLQVFLSKIFRVNYSSLNIPVEDYSSLAPKGFAYSVQNECVIYNYDIICTNRLGFDVITLKQVLNGLIGQEIFSRGLSGLQPCYQNVISVFIDRIIYDGKTLQLEVLYINSPKSLEYYYKALERDKKQLKNEKAVNRLLKLLSER